MISKKQESHMRWAIALALEGQGGTSPNPMVGAVIVRGNRIVGEGYHKKAGTSHAEIHAISMAKGKTKGADLYVTLEPCVHEGRTPPCVPAIIKSGIKRVFVGTRDPNPKVNGRGIRGLKKARIRVVEGVLEKSCREINETYNKFISKKVPYVVAKAALSLDGKIATFRGESRWITNDECRNYVHRLRSGCDAVLVGAGTVKADDPRLNVRIKNFSGTEPRAIIVDEDLSLSRKHKIFKRRPGELIVATTKGSSRLMRCWLSGHGHPVIDCKKTKEGTVDISDMLGKLAKMGITSILVEGGGKIFADFFFHRQVDRLVACIAPKLIGGLGKDFLPNIGIEKMKNAITLRSVQIQNFGDNLVIEGVLNK